MKTIDITVSYTPAEALAMAQFMKRVGWHEFIENAVDEKEAEIIRDAVSKTQDALSQSGYSPR